MIIYSTRHGQTDYNFSDRILGVTDIPLNDTGIRQAQELAERIKSDGGLGIELIIASPMQRALTTAGIVSLHNDIPMITDSRLKEWDYGRYEGLHRTAEGFAENKREFAVSMGESGESLLRLSHRVYSVLDEIKKKYKGSNVLLVSHGGICRVIETYFSNMTTAEFSSWFMGNCELRKYEIK